MATPSTAITGYNTHRPEDKQAMLGAIGKSQISDLFAAVPASLKLNRPLNVPAALPEWALARHMQGLSDKNATVKTYNSFLGGGAYEHMIPAVVDAIVSRGEFLTSYTPYQPEISQGLLQALFEYQTALAAVTGLPVVNGSCYDGATALADAAWACCLISKKNTDAELLISEAIWPQYKTVLNTYLDGRAIERHALGFDAKTGRIDPATLDEFFTRLGAGEDLTLDAGKKQDFREPERSVQKYVSTGSVENEAFSRPVVKESLARKPAGFLFQTPNALGVFEDVKAIAEVCAKHGVISACSFNPLASGIVTPPGEQGIDIVTCDGQPLGLPLNAGGPTLGVFATRREYRKYVPGRLIGKVTDINGNLAYALVFEDREQHVARERATSNICSNQALNALRAVMFLASVGESGISKLASLNARKAHYLADKLSAIPGVTLAFTGPFFNEFVVTLPKAAAPVLKTLQAQRIFGGIDYSGKFGLTHALLVTATEVKTKADMDAFADALKKVLA